MLRTTSQVIRSLSIVKRYNFRTLINRHRRFLPAIVILARIYSTSRTYTASSLSLAMNLKEIVKTLEAIAPSATAEEWDNVGLLIEPSCSSPITHILLTNDLTEQVMTETLKLKAEGTDVGLIISYHPPIFRPLKRLTQSTAKERIIIKALESNIAIYSPHTAHDALWGGVNDWALSGLGDGTITPLSTKQVSDGKGLILKVGGIKNKVECEKVVELLKDSLSKDYLIDKKETIEEQEIFSIQYRVNSKVLTKAVPMVTNLLKGYDVSVVSGEKTPVPGAGRLFTFTDSIRLDKLITQIKSHFELQHIRIATPEGVTVSDHVTTVAVCVGSGTSVLKTVQAQVYLTGEMSHHEVLDATSRGITCILCEHSNTERGFLKVFKAILEDKLDSSVKILISKKDRDPIDIV